MMWLWYLLYQWWYQQQLVRREGVGSAVLVVLPLLTWKMIMSKHDKSLRKTLIQTLTSHLSNVLRMCLNSKFWYPKVKLVSWSEISILDELRGPCFAHRELLSRPFGNSETRDDCFFFRGYHFQMGQAVFTRGCSHVAVIFETMFLFGLEINMTIQHKATLALQASDKGFWGGFVMPEKC